MATWMTHLRIGDLIYDAISASWLDPLYFGFGSIAPDCGIPLPDGSYDPPKEETHYGHSNHRDYARFARERLTDQAGDREYSFYLGYYLHLVTDEAWLNQVFRVERDAFRATFPSDIAFNQTIKNEYDVLDARFLKQNGSPRLLTALTEAGKVPALRCPFIRQDALEAQFLRTVDQYRTPVSSDAPTIYLPQEANDDFIEGLANCLIYGMPRFRNEIWIGWPEKIRSLQSPLLKV